VSEGHGAGLRRTADVAASSAHGALGGIESLHDVQVIDAGDGDLIAIGQPSAMNDFVRHDPRVGPLLDAAAGVLGATGVVLALGWHRVSSCCVFLPTPKQ